MDKKTKKLTNLDKIANKIKNDPQYVANLILENEMKENEAIILNLTLDGPPESYSRERKGRGKHFYNPKGDKMTTARELLKQSISDENKQRLTELFKNENAKYDVHLDITYFIPIQKSSSIKDGVLKEMGLILPESRPDIDNYDKFILDTLHEIAYADDSHVVEIHSYKKYSLTPRTEISACIIIK